MQKLKLLLPKRIFKMKKIILGLCAALTFVSSTNAQDVHFSQYFSSPLTLNPAMTGLVQNDTRLATNYRSQWGSVSTNPYLTGTITFDMATMRGKLNNGDALGIGLMMLYDKSGTGELTNTSVGLSTAYHHAFGFEKRNTISFGVQGMLVMKSIDFTKLTFEDQFNPATGTITGPSSDYLDHHDLNYPDFNAGVMYTGKISDFATAYLGGSYYHLTQPVETFLKKPNLGSGTDHKISSRYTAYIGGSFTLNENVVLYASGLYQQQASSTEIVLGSAVGFVLNPGYDPEFMKSTVFYLGGWYRYSDAIAPYIALEWSKYQVAFSYDVNISSFTPATNGNGAYEVSFIFNGKNNKRIIGPKYNFACPKF
jgi:type IX secretion system PorP/SprF family membrane protein